MIPGTAKTGRNTAIAAAVSLVLMTAGAAGAAFDDDADRCPAVGRAVGDGSLPVGVRGADFGSIPEACIGSDAWLRLRGTLLVAASAPDFYGSIAAASNLRLRYALGPRWMFWFSGDVATYRFVQNAVVNSSSVGVGPPTLGIARAVAAAPRILVTVFSRALLPVETARRESVVFGGELGASATATGSRPGLGVQGGVSFAVPVTVTHGQTRAALATTAVAEGWASGPRLAGTLGAFCRFQPAPHLQGTSSVGVRAGSRVALRRGFWLAAVTELPLIGEDRTDLVLALFAGFTPAGGRWRQSQ